MTSPVELAAMRCAARSLALDEDLAGTASTVRAFLLLQHGGPWGSSAVRDAPMPRAVSAALLAAYADLGVRPLLIRRHRDRPGLPRRPLVALAVCGPDGGRGASCTLGRPQEVAKLPVAELVAALRSGATPPGWDDAPLLFLTCTHGRHDICCAERGRPVATAIDKLAPDGAWEVSHIGGDRFAGNVLVLPEGLYYGRVAPARARELVAAHEHGHCVPDLMRGRASLPFAAQVAEIALRRHLGATALSAVTLTGTATSGRRTTTSWAGAHGRWRVVVDTSYPGPARSVTCSTAALVPPVHTVVEIGATEPDAAR